MAVNLSVTETEYVIDLDSYRGLGASTLDIVLPSSSSYRSHYRDRELPAVYVFSVGSLLSGDDSLEVTVTVDGGENIGDSSSVGFTYINVPPQSDYYVFRTFKSISYWVFGKSDR